MKTDKNLYTLIMAGGIGSRFWPLSRTGFPKQFHDILGTGRTLLQMTFDRVRQVCPPENILVVTNARYADLVLKQLPELGPEQVLREPYMRNTAPCIAYGTFKVLSKNPNALFLVAPSDHLILDQKEFNDIISVATKRALDSDDLITLGIQPSRPDTGYGYIQHTELKTPSDARVRKVKTFTEKPDIKLAEQFIESGDFCWNAGIFLWKGSTISRAFDKHLHDMYVAFSEGNAVYNTPEEAKFLEKTFAECDSISIDFGILEKAANVSVVLSDFGWSDLGTWGSLYAQMQHDKQGNAVVGEDAILQNASGNIINLPKGKLGVVRGLKDYIVVESDGVLLICPKADEQEIRNIVNDIRITRGEKFV